ncbi:MAG: thiocyanate desulfurase, partial [Alphaproteobacteria bacterium]|nr:thiocyanate desulfurase [Alphaproteobacteria bacterium]
MSGPKKTTIKDASAVKPKIELEPQQGQGASVERYLKRRAEVTEEDHREFQDYLEQKARRVAPVDDPRPKNPSLVNRRNLLKVVAGTAVAGEAAAVGYSWVKAGPASDAPAGSVLAGPQREPIIRQMTDSKADVGGRNLGKWILLLPTKLGGGTYAIDLNSNRVLASIWYWTYGDYNPISHHLCAFPSADPYHSFEFVNSTQGGKNCLIYGIPTRMETPGPGFNIYRVRYDGAQM